jgi:hypothetical protein
LAGGLAVAALTFVAYVLCIAPAPYLLDSAELATATFGLGVAHPPGEPTALLWGKPFDLLPVGNVAFRAGLGQAVAGALAASLVYLLVLEAGTLLDRDSKVDVRARVLLAVGTALVFGFAPGVIIAANRPEVYALQTALSLAALWLALRGWRTGDARPTLIAGLLIGLGVANHSLIAGLVGLGAVVAALPLLRKPSPRARLIVFAVLAFAVGMAIHAYLPVRAAALFASPDHGADQVLWGDARTWAGLRWVVSARTFVNKQGVVQDQSSPGDLPFVPMEELTEVFALLAPLGAYLLLRRRETRVPGLALVVGCAGSLGAALVGGMAPLNPDTRGYLGPAFATLAVLAGLALLAGLAVFRWTRLRPFLAALLVVGALSRFPSPTAYPGLRATTAGDAAAADLLSELPPRAALFTNHFETAFLVGYRRLVEASRPDVAWAHLAFAGGPGYSERLGLAEPELAPVLRAYREGQLSISLLRDLDGRHPVRLEADIMTAPELRAALFPSGAFWAPQPGRPGKPLAGWMIDQARGDRQVRGYLAWRAYIDAVWACQTNQRTRADLRLADLERLVPNDERYGRLRATCGH